MFEIKIIMAMEKIRDRYFFDMKLLNLIIYVFHLD